jgi:hypothetical protein
LLEPIDLDLDVEGELTDRMPETAPPQPSSSAPAFNADRAEGLESIEFSPPSGPVDRAHDLGGSLESGEFTAPAAPIAPLAGLEESGIGAFERSIPDGGPPLPMLDTSEAYAPPHDTHAAEEIPAVGPSTVEFSVPILGGREAASGRAETLSMPELEPEGDSLPEPRSEIPPELPPAVIAAEASLIDLGELEEPPPPTTTAPVSASPVTERESAAPTPQAPFVTETMAELFLKQGFRDQALDVYRQLLAANPADERLQRRVAELEPAGPAAAGDSVRDFLARIATLRPGERTAAQAPPSDDDFATFDSPPPAEPATHGVVDQLVPTSTPASSPAMSTGLERGAATQGAGGSIDALFGNRAVGTSEDSAASALAQAFGGADVEPAAVITGRPARAAAGELSLDSVFRDSPPRSPRTSQSFSFDQFFSSESAAADRAPSAPPPAPSEPAPSEPAERSADDIEQFNSWLQGLKPK